jgi:microcystin-dependent protein
MADRRRNLGIPSGVVFPFAGNTAPYGYLICDGRAVSRTEYASLFMMIGTSHGIGDGSTTFNLPDYRGNFLRGRVDITTVTGSGTAASNDATFTNHGINRTGFKVRLSSGTLSGLATSTDYFAIVVDDNTLAFASSFANAIAGTKIAITGANSAVIVQYEDPDYSSRAASNIGGNSGNGIGSRQTDELKSHSHFLNAAVHVNVNSPNQNIDDAAPRWRNGNSSATGGNETRPQNMLVNYIIKV